jgi:hypothetical protein
VVSGYWLAVEQEALHIDLQATPYTCPDAPRGRKACNVWGLLLRMCGFPVMEPSDRHTVDTISKHSMMYGVLSSTP